MKEIKIVKFEGSDPTTDTNLSTDLKTIDRIYKEGEVAEGQTFWDSLFEHAGSIIGGTLAGIGALKNGGETMTQAEIDEYNRKLKESESATSFGTIFLYVGGAIIVLVLGYILIKRRS